MKSNHLFFGWASFERSCCSFKVFV